MSKLESTRWYYHSKYNCVAATLSPRDDPQALICHLDKKNDEALGRFIAAEPEMYEALKECERALCDHVQYEGAEPSAEGNAWRAAVAVIAKVENKLAALRGKV